MREFDHTGILLAEYQGKIFEKSVDLNCSTAIFVRRFLHSNYLKKLDMNDLTSISLDVNEALDSIQSQFGDSDYGKVKYSKNALFWIGYMYRYISYTRETRTQFLFKIFNYKQMMKLYYVYHTQDPEWCIKSLLELNKLDENIFDNNYRLKIAIKKRL